MPTVCSAKKVKKLRRRALTDLTNSDSPICGLAPPTAESASPISPDTPGTPGIGEDLLRSQVNLLLQQVHSDVSSRGPLFGFHAGLSPGVGPTPANTPEAALSTPTLFPENTTVADSFCLDTDEWKKECGGSIHFELLEEARHRRTASVSDISTITIAETVVSSRQTSLLDRYITRSLDFDSLLEKMSKNEVGTGSK